MNHLLRVLAASAAALTLTVTGALADVASPTADAVASPTAGDPTDPASTARACWAP